jgi:hypothetical protein
MCEDDLSDEVALKHLGEAFDGFAKGQYRVDGWAYPGSHKEVGESFELVPGAHGGAKDLQLGEKDPVQVGCCGAA